MIDDTIDKLENSSTKLIKDPSIDTLPIPSKDLSNSSPKVLLTDKQNQIL